MSGIVWLDMEDLLAILEGPAEGEIMTVDLGESTLLDGEEIYTPRVISAVLGDYDSSPLDRLDDSEGLQPPEFEGCPGCGDLDGTDEWCPNCYDFTCGRPRCEVCD